MRWFTIVTTTKQGAQELHNSRKGPPETTIAYAPAKAALANYSKDQSKERTPEFCIV